MSRKEAYERKLQAQLDEWEAEIARMKAKADQADADAQLELNKQIDALKKQQQGAQAKLEELRNAGDSAFEDLKAGMESAWLDLSNAFEKARSRF